MSGHVGLVLPGGGAGPYAAPVLIPWLALEEVGAQVEVVPYPDFRPASLEREAAPAFDAFVAGEVRRILASQAWSRVTFMAKSRGTLFLSVMSGTVAGTVDAIWVTPLLGFDYVRAGVVEKGWRSLVVAGDADPYHDAGAHREVCDSLGATSLVLPGADHGLVVHGDVRATVEGYRRLAEGCLAFASQSAT